MQRLAKSVVSALGFEIRRKQKTAVSARQSAQAFLAEVNLPKDAICFDVGANTGQSIAALRRNPSRPRVLGFEPMNALYEDLKVRHGNDDDVTILNQGLSSISGRAGFHVNSDLKLSSVELLNPNSQQVQGKEVSEVEIELTTLDDVVAAYQLPHVDLLKIDVQGHEASVLTGGMKSLKNGVFNWIVLEILFGDAYAVEGDQAAQIFAMLSKTHRLHAILDCTYIGKEGDISHADFVFRRRR